MKSITETIKSLISSHGEEILQQPQRLKAMLADLLPNEKRMRYLLDLSLQADMPKKLMAIQNETSSVWDTNVSSIKYYFKEEYFLEDKPIKMIFDCWVEVLPRKEVNGDFETVTDIEKPINITVPKLQFDFKNNTIIENQIKRTLHVVTYMNHRPPLVRKGNNYTAREILEDRNYKNTIHNRNVKLKKGDVIEFGIIDGFGKQSWSAGGKNYYYITLCAKVNGIKGDISIGTFTRSAKYSSCTLEDLQIELSNNKLTVTDLEEKDFYTFENGVESATKTGKRIVYIFE